LKHLKLKKLIVIGASTGGPSHITKIVSSLDSHFNATIIIAQHMGSAFIPSFVSRLNECSRLSVVLIADGLQIKNGYIYVCTGLVDITNVTGTQNLHVTKNSRDTYNPNIDHMFSSASKLLPQVEVLSIILTGIGEDGVEGSFEISQRGGYCIAESEESAVVYGMPARTKEKVSNIQVKNLQDIIKEIKKFGD